MDALKYNNNANNIEFIKIKINYNLAYCYK